MSTLDPLGAHLEQSVPATERHGRGQYFTPDSLVRFVLSLVPTEGGPPQRVLDPACGSGRFLLGVEERWGRGVSDLVGYDTDSAARERALQQLPEAKISPQSFLEARPQGQFDLVVGNPPYVRRRGIKRDLYVDFIETSLDHLADNGCLAFVLSNAWLSVEYGRLVQKVLLEKYAIDWIVESSAESWFSGASVNTMVLVARRCDDAERRAANQVRFGVLNEPLPSQPEIVRSVAQGTLSSDRAWAPMLRAPDLYLELSRSDRTTPLGELASISRGFTTNDNGFFYPDSNSGIEAEFLAPLLKGPRDIPGVRCRSDELRHQVLLVSEDRKEISHAEAPGLLRWAKAHGRGKDPSSWTLRPQEPAQLFLAKGYHDRFRQALSDKPVFADQQIYLVHPRAEIGARLLASLLNSSWFQLALELTGRVNFGDGVLWLGLKDARQHLCVPSLRAGLRASSARLGDLFDALPDEPVPRLGTYSDHPQWREARDRLDREIAGLLNLDWGDYLSLREAGESLCARRLSLAKVRRESARS